MKIKILPIAQVALVAILMWGVQHLTPGMNIQSAMNLPLCITTMTVGLWMVLAGGKAFLKNKTTVNPLSPEKTTHLVTRGVYRYSRNPMYLGFTLCLVAWAFFMGSYVSFIGIPIFIWSITTYQIIPEELALERLFGESFIEYKKQVRRWM